MDISDIDLNLLAAFDAVLRTQSVSQGAASLGLSQPAMSFALAKLRKIFNDPLFVRTSRGMQPTPRALQLAGPINKVLDLIRSEVLQEPTFDPANASRTFTFSMSDIGEMVFLPKLLLYVRKAAPGVNIRSVTMPPSLLEQAMEAGEVDLAVGYFPDLKKAGFYQQRLFRHAFVCIARADHPSIGDSLTLEAFLETPHAVVSSEGRSQEVFDRLLEERGLKRRVLLSIPHFMSIPFIVNDSDLIVTLPRAVGTSFAKLANIKLLEPPLENPTFDLKQHWHTRFHHDAANRWLRGVIYQLFAEDINLEAGQSPEDAEPWRTGLPSSLKS